jgi:hypothetical protein
MDFTAFASAHPETRDLVRNWYEEARLEEHRRPNAAFQPFMHLWISFNAWAARVTGAQNDAAMIKELAANRRLNEAFDALFLHSDGFERTARRFAAFWPIFSVIEVRRRGLYDLLHGNGRWEALEKLLAAGVRRGPTRFYDRDCPTWDMSIEAIYVVRCNLFHGDKGDAEDDLHIVHAAYKTLADFIEGTGLYDWAEN